MKTISSDERLSCDASLWAAACLVALTVAAWPATAADPALPATTPFVDYLATWKIDRGSRAVLEEPSAWSPAKQEITLKVLARLARLPAPLVAQWNAEAVDLRSLAATQRVQDLMVKVEGRATFVATVPLTEGEAELAGRRQMEMVRIVSDDGLTVDVLADHVPKAWPRAAMIDEPTVVIGRAWPRRARGRRADGGSPRGADRGPERGLVSADAAGGARHGLWPLRFRR